MWLLVLDPVRPVARSTASSTCGNMFGKRIAPYRRYRPSKAWPRVPEVEVLEHIKGLKEAILPTSRRRSDDTARNFIIYIMVVRIMSRSRYAALHPCVPFCDVARFTCIFSRCLPESRSCPALETKRWPSPLLRMPRNKQQATFFGCATVFRGL